MRQEAHEKGMEAALRASGMEGWDHIEDRLNDFLTNYLYASDQVILPREPTTRMLSAAAKAMSPGNRPTPDFVSNSQKHKIRYQAMVAAYTEIPLSGESNFTLANERSLIVTATVVNIITP